MVLILKRTGPPPLHHLLRHSTSCVWNSNIYLLGRPNFTISPNTSEKTRTILKTRELSEQIDCFYISLHTISLSPCDIVFSLLLNVYRFSILKVYFLEKSLHLSDSSNVGFIYIIKS